MMRLILLITLMLLASCGSTKFVERTDTVWKERRDTITMTITKTVKDTTREVHNFYYTINNAGDTVLNNQIHYLYRASETKDSSDYYKAMWEKEREKQKETSKEEKEKDTSNPMSTTIAIAILILVLMWLLKVIRNIK